MYVKRQFGLDSAGINILCVYFVTAIGFGLELAASLGLHSISLYVCVFVSPAQIDSSEKVCIE